MQTFKNGVLAMGLLGAFGFSAPAGEIKPGSVPGSLNYQGRLDRDNAPVTGPVHLTFRIYGVPENGTPLYTAPEITVNAAQGIFSVTITPPWSVFSAAGTLYLEVQVESDVLSPREPLNSVAYAIVAKKLEDGASVSVSTLTAAYQVLLATVSGNVGIGTISPGEKLSVSGSIKLLNPSNAIIFSDNTSMVTAGVGTSVSGVTSPVDSTLDADSDANNTGDMVFRTSGGERLRVKNAAASGWVGIGDFSAATPLGRLDVDGALYVGTEGIYDRDDSVLNVKQDLIVEGGTITGANGEYISAGETDNLISLVSGGIERLRIDPNGNVSVGNTVPPADANFYAAGNIHGNAGVRGGAVSVGAYTGWTSASNEIRSAGGSALLLQQNNPYNVGIGTDSPKEKLHVRGSVKADYGISAATAAFSDDVVVRDNFTANSRMGSWVELSSTTIYGTLLVTGGVGSNQGLPGYIASTQTFTGQNTFLNQVKVSSDVIVSRRVGVGAGAADFSFGPSNYLQIGDGLIPGDNASAYLKSGASGNARMYFYRNTSEAGRFETQDGNNLALVVGNTKSLVDSTYYRIYNSAFWVSTGANTTPAIFVSSWMGNVGVGTSVLDPNWKLTVDGNLRLASGALIFPDGSSMATSSAAAAISISNNADAVVQSDADINGSGKVILRAGTQDGLVLNTGGNVGVGTQYPVAKLNVRGGDLVLGTPYNPYAADNMEDLLVAGNVVIDGNLEQRSASQVIFKNLSVSGEVHLSTATGARTGIGNDAPAYRLDVTGDINASGSIRTGGTVRISNTGGVGSGGLDATWDGATINVNRGGTGAATLTSGGILYGNGASAIGALAAMSNGQLLIGDGSGAPALATLTPTVNQVNVTNGAGTITLSLPQDVHTAATPTFASLTVGPLTSAILTDNGSRLTVLAPADLSGSLTTASSGTFKASGLNQFSLETSSGIYIKNGRLRMAEGAGADYVLTSDASGNARWQSDTAGGSNYIQATVATNDYIRVRGFGVANSGYLDIATADDGTEPIYVKQYSGFFAVLVRQATLLDGSGNTDFPGTVTAPTFSGALSGNAATASALAANGANCAANSFPLGVNASGAAETCSNSISGNAATASALAANGANCAANSFPLGVDASGAAETCTNNISGNAATATKPAVAGTSGKAACWKADGSLGSCTTQPNASGDCACS